MSTGSQSTAASDFSLDSERHTLATTWRNYVAKLRSGDLGPIPAMLGIGVLTIIFGFARSDTFLSVRNFGNLLQQAAPIIVISMAVSSYCSSGRSTSAPDSPLALSPRYWRRASRRTGRSRPQSPSLRWSARRWGCGLASSWPRSVSHPSS